MRPPVSTPAPDSAAAPVLEAQGFRRRRRSTEMNHQLVGLARIFPHQPIALSQRQGERRGVECRPEGGGAMNRRQRQAEPYCQDEMVLSGPFPRVSEIRSIFRASQVLPSLHPRELARICGIGVSVLGPCLVRYGPGFLDSLSSSLASGLLLLFGLVANLAMFNEKSTADIAFGR